MPRQPLGDQAMTATERTRKRRERLRQERGPADQSPAAVIDALRKKNAALLQQLAAATAAPHTRQEPTAKAAPGTDRELRQTDQRPVRDRRAAQATG